MEKRADKARAQEALREKMRSAKSIVFVDFRGVTVADDTRLRKACREGKVEYRVVKNTLARRAANELGWHNLSQVFEGPTSMAISEIDPVAAAKVLVGLARELPAVRIKGGVLGDGGLMSPERVAFLGTLPAREELLATVAAAMRSPITSLVTVLDGVLGGFARAVNALREKREGAVC